MAEAPPAPGDGHLDHYDRLLFRCVNRPRCYTMRGCVAVATSPATRLASCAAGSWSALATVTEGHCSHLKRRLYELTG